MSLEGNNTAWSNRNHPALATQRSFSSISSELVEIARTPTPKYTNDAKISATQQTVRPVGFLDNYEVIGGVPSFTFKPIGNDKWAFRIFAVSVDGTRMAISFRPDIIHVYDLLNNFSLTAKGAFDWCIDYLEFWNSRNDILVVLFENRTICTLFIPDKGDLSFVTNHQIDKEVDKGLDPADSVDDDETTYWDFSAAVFEGEMWLVEKNSSGAMFVTSISQKSGAKKVQVCEGSFIKATRLVMCIPYRRLMAVYEHEDLRLNRTRVWSHVNFEKENSNQTPVELPGQGLCWSGDGKHLLIWKVDEDLVSSVELYICDTLTETKNASPLNERHLGFGVLALRAKFLSRETFPLKSIQEAHSQEPPLIAALVTRQKGISLLVWDPSTDEVIMERDLTMKKMDLGAESRVEFCISPNLKWIAVGCWKDGLVGLFSLWSGACAWSIQLDMCKIDDPCFIPIVLDPTSTKLIVNTENALFSFTPPCLLEKELLQFGSSTYRLDLESTRSILDINVHRRKLIPKHMLWYSLSLSLQQKVLVHSPYMYNIDVGISVSSSRTAVLARNLDSLSVFLGTLETFFSSSFQRYLEENFSSKGISYNFDEIRIREDFPRPQFSVDGLPVFVFLYYDERKKDDSLAVFSLVDGLVALFIDLDKRRDQEIVQCSTGAWFCIKQSEDSKRVFCLGDKGVLIIDLNRRRVIKHVVYEANLSLRLDLFFTCNWDNQHRPKDYIFRLILGQNLTFTNVFLRTKGAGPFDISDDGTTILLGWDSLNDKRLLLKSDMQDEEFEEMQKQAGDLAPCWALSNDLEQVAFLEFDKENDCVSSIGTCDNKNEVLLRLSREDWNPHQRRILGEISINDLLSYCLKMDKEKKCLWLMILTKDKHRKAKLTWIPLSPYSIEGCLPYMPIQDFLIRDIDLSELKRQANKYGDSLFNMEFNGVTNTELILRKKDTALLSNLIQIVVECGSCLDLDWNTLDSSNARQGLLEQAISTKDDIVSNFALESFKKRVMAFSNGATMMKECFGSLWTNYRAQAEDLLLEDHFAWPLCEVEVPATVFESKKYLDGQLETSDTIFELKHNPSLYHSSQQWNLMNHHCLERIARKKARTTKTIATVKVFCMDDVCKVGLNGILRFLLIRGVPSYIFKSNLVKYVIMWKWEKLWKSRCQRNFAVYSVFLMILTMYAISITCFSAEGEERLFAETLATLLLFILMFAATIMLLKEYTQLQTYIRDGLKVVPNDYFCGAKYYFSIRWQCGGVIGNIILLTLVPLLHFLSLHHPSFLSLFYGIVAVEIILAWKKMWYFAQSFQHTGMIVFMIENVIKDSLFFLLLAFVVLLAFGVALFIVFQHILNGEFDKDTEKGAYTVSSFGSLPRTMVTLLYVVVGMFEPQVLFNCGSLTPLTVGIFICYLGIQMIVMLNMLVSIMGDTFDRVKSTEEEQLLIGRAQFIDSFEAALSEEQIKNIEKHIGKYLYVIFSHDPDTEEERVWHGRTRRGEDNVRKIVKQSEGNVRRIMLEQQNDLMAKIVLAKELLERTEHSIREFESRSQQHAMGIEDRIMRRLEEKFESLEHCLRAGSFPIRLPLEGMRSCSANNNSSMLRNDLPPSP